MGRIVVTGAAGFIGSHTVEALLARGHEVVGVDNLRTGKLSNLEAARSRPGFSFVQADAAQDGALAGAVAIATGDAGARVDAIVHLAALVSVPESIQNPEENYRLNVRATHLVAEAARAWGGARVVFASSAAVYGNCELLPLDEEAPKGPISPYGAAKLASEALLLGHGAAYGMTVRCQRYFNVYGPRQDPKSPYSGVLSAFTDRYAAGRAPTIFGDGEQTRDFVYVGDVARANALAATEPAVRSGVANICTGRAASLNEVIGIYRRLFSGAAAPDYGPARAGDIRHSRGRPDRAERELAFKAAFTLEEGLKHYLSATLGRDLG